MFVLESTYQKLQARYRALDQANDELLDRWNKLVRRINALGGESFLANPPKEDRLTQLEIKNLIRLCHPDKHNGRLLAVEMTQKLLSLKE